MFVLVRRATVESVIEGLKEFTGKGRISELAQQDHEAALRAALDTRGASVAIGEGRSTPLIPRIGARVSIRLWPAW